MKRYLSEIDEALSAYPRRTSAQVPESYIGGGQSKLRYIGLRVPHLHETMRKGFSFTRGRSENAAKAWEYVWNNSGCFEVMALALAWFGHPKQEEDLLSHWPRLKRWSRRIDNWAHADALSSIYAKILEQSPEQVYATFQRWSESRNPWLRRLSMVSLLYYSRQRKKGFFRCRRSWPWWSRSWNTANTMCKKGSAGRCARPATYIPPKPTSSSRKTSAASAPSLFRRPRKSCRR